MGNGLAENIRVRMGDGRQRGEEIAITDGPLVDIVGRKGVGVSFSFGGDRSLLLEPPAFSGRVTYLVSNWATEVSPTACPEAFSWSVGGILEAAPGAPAFSRIANLRSALGLVFLRVGGVPFPWTYRFWRTFG